MHKQYDWCTKKQPTLYYEKATKPKLVPDIFLSLISHFEGLKHKIIYKYFKQNYSKKYETLTFGIPFKNTIGSVLW